VSQQTTDKKADSQGSPRSQRLAFEEQNLRKELAQAIASIAATEGKISESEDLVAGLTRRMVAGTHGKFLESLDRENERLRALK
jgi:uncharacterized tellurite resistance protein B-like protein